MKILFINDISNTSSSLSQSLSSFGITGKIFLFSTGSKRQGLRTRIFNGLSRVKQFFELKKLIKKYKPDYLHINFGYYGILGRLFKVPYFLHFHGTDAREHLKKPFFKFLNSIAAKKAKLIFYSTPDLKDIVTKNFKNAFFLANPVKTNEFKEKDIIKNADFFLISKMDITKGSEKAIKALIDLKKTFPKLKIKIFNFGNDLNALNLIKENKDKFQTIDQPLNYDKIPDEINKSKYIIGQLSVGALGMSELEALSCNKKLICYYDPKFYKDSSYSEMPPVFNASSVSEIYDNCLKIMKSKKTDDARSWINKYHSSLAIAKKYFKMVNMTDKKIFIHPTAEVNAKAKVGNGTKVWNNAQIREGARIGKNCHISKDVYIDQKVIIGNNVKIANQVSVYKGINIKDDVIIGPNVTFTNDKYPRSFGDWKIGKITVEKGASVGAGSVIIPSIKIGKYAMTGAGTIVTKNISDQYLVTGNPGKIRGVICKCGKSIIRLSEISRYRSNNKIIFHCKECNNKNIVTIDKCFKDRLKSFK